MGGENKTLIQKIFSGKGKKKTLICVLSLVVVCLVGVFVYLISLNKDSDIPEEKEFYNEKYGVKFEYPGNWVVLETSGGNPGALVLRLGKSEDTTSFVFDYRLESKEISRCVYSDTKGIHLISHTRLILEIAIQK